MNGPVDILGVPIEVGDTVTYAVNTRHGGLQIGIVTDLVPFPSTRVVANPAFDPSRPATWNNGINDRNIREDFTDFKIKFKEPDQRTEDEHGNPRTYPGRVKTLGDTSRFAVVRKYNPQRAEIVQLGTRYSSTYV